MTEQRRGEATRALADQCEADRNRWVNPLWLGQAFDEWCADLDAQAAIDEACRRRAAEIDAKGGKEKKVGRADVLAVLAALVRRAKPWTMTADLTAGQISIVTAQSTKSVESCLSIARQLDHIVNVDNARKPLNGRAGRAPKRLLLFLVDRVERIASASRLDSPDEIGREVSTNTSACRPPLNSSLTNSARNKAGNTERHWCQELTSNVISELATKKGVRVAAIRGAQLGRETERRVNDLDPLLHSLPPDDNQLVAWLADSISGKGGSQTTYQRLEERAREISACQPTSITEQTNNPTPPKGIPA